MRLEQRDREVDTMEFGLGLKVGLAAASAVAAAGTVAAVLHHDSADGEPIGVGAVADNVMGAFDRAPRDGTIDVATEAERVFKTSTQWDDSVTTTVNSDGTIKQIPGKVPVHETTWAKSAARLVNAAAHAAGHNDGRASQTEIAALVAGFDVGGRGATAHDDKLSGAEFHKFERRFGYETIKHERDIPLG